MNTPKTLLMHNQKHANCGYDSGANTPKCVYKHILTADVIMNTSKCIIKNMLTLEMTMNTPKTLLMHNQKHTYCEWILPNA